MTGNEFISTGEMDFRVAITTDPDANVTFRVHFPEAEGETTRRETESLEKNLADLALAHAQLLQTHDQLQRDTSHSQTRLLELTQTHCEEQAQTHTKDLAAEADTLQATRTALETALAQKNEQIARMNNSIREQESRKKNAESLLVTAEREGKEKIEDAVKKGKELTDCRKKVNELVADLQRARRDLEHEMGLTEKREEQMQLLLEQLQKRESEQEALRRDIARKDEEHRRLQEELEAVQSRAQLPEPPRDLEEARGLAEARVGEMQQAKEVIRNYHQQLRLKKGEVEQLRRQAEAKSVRLPPIQSASGRRPPLERKSVSSETPVPPSDC